MVALLDGTEREHATRVPPIASLVELATALAPRPLLAVAHRRLGPSYHAGRPWRRRCAGLRLLRLQDGCESEGRLQLSRESLMCGLLRYPEGRTDVRPAQALVAGFGDHPGELFVAGFQHVGEEVEGAPEELLLGFKDVLLILDGHIQGREEARAKPTAGVGVCGFRPVVAVL
jgi:hypothetical protein